MRRGELEREEEFARRLQRCREVTAERGLDALLVIGRGPDRAGDLLYLADHRPLLPGHPTLYNFRGRGFGALFLPLEGDPVLMVTTPFYGEVVIKEVRVSTDLPFAVAEVIETKGFSRGNIGLVGEDVLTVTLYKDLMRLLPKVNFVDAGDIVMNLRSIKSDYEIRILQRGAAIADEVAESLKGFLREGLREEEVVAFIVEELRRRGVEAPSATCQSGVRNSGEPMVPEGATDRVLREGDMVHMEINGRLHGYMIDICRSTVIGKPTRKHLEVLELVGEMLERSIKALRPGMRAEELERIAGEIALRRGYASHFTIAFGGPATYLGHGIGLGIDEPPILAKGMKTLIKENMVLTIEPGIYRTEVGGARVENEVLVTEDGAVPLNESDWRWW